MSTINQITVGSTTYDIEDLTARKAIMYCYCSSSADSATKYLNPKVSGWTPIDTSIIAVYFEYSNTSNNVQLALRNGSYKKSIYLSSTGSTYSGNDPHYCGMANHYLFYIWDEVYQVWTWLGINDIFSGEYIPVALGSNQTISNALNNTVPNTRTVNGIALSSNVTLEGDKIRTTIWDTDPNVDQPFYIDDELRDINLAMNVLNNDKVPYYRTINGHALSSNISLTAADVGALPSTHTVVRLSNVTCNANSAVGDFATVNNAAISSNHAVANIVFSKPNYIRSDVTWTTTDGSLTLNGRCYQAITADIILVYNDVLVS